LAAQEKQLELKSVDPGEIKMTQNPSDQKTQNTNDQNQKMTCGVCHQSFNSERELQDHQKNAHAQRKQNESQSGSEGGSKDNPAAKGYSEKDEPKREKIA
jgi:hypothetical protein